MNINKKCESKIDFDQNFRTMHDTSVMRHKCHALFWSSDQNLYAQKMHKP